MINIISFSFCTWILPVRSFICLFVCICMYVLNSIEIQSMISSGYSNPNSHFEINFMIFSSTGFYLWIKEWQCECLNTVYRLCLFFCYTCSILWLSVQMCAHLIGKSGANSNNISEVLETFANQYWNEHSVKIDRTAWWCVKHKRTSNSDSVV